MISCGDLEAYVVEMGKRNVLLVNKADFLTDAQRTDWTAYFDSIGLPHAFYSAATENDLVSKKEKIEEEDEFGNADSNEEDSESESEEAEVSSQPVKEDLGPKAKPILNRIQLIQFLKSFKSCPTQSSAGKEEGSRSKNEEGVFIVGFCGHPNVGKSSTINSLMAAKKTSVSSTPGKTKHFQVPGKLASVHPPFAGRILPVTGF